MEMIFDWIYLIVDNEPLLFRLMFFLGILNSGFYPNSRETKTKV